MAGMREAWIQSLTLPALASKEETPNHIMPTPGRWSRGTLLVEQPIPAGTTRQTLAACSASLAGSKGNNVGGNEEETTTL